MLWNIRCKGMFLLLIVLLQHLFDGDADLQLRYDLMDCHISICSPEVGLGWKEVALWV